MKLNKIKLGYFCSICFFSNGLYANETLPALGYDSVIEFINEYKFKNKYSKEELVEIFARTKITKSVIKKSNNQPEKKLTWESYQKKVVTNKKIEEGKRFIENNYETLNKAEKIYGVPKEIIASIIGIESFYGKYKGNHKAINAISTMAFEGSKKRQAFFKKELESYLDNSWEYKLNPLEQKSSWAGAFGYPQFISSSIKAYGVDFDKNGKIDLNNSIIDSIGSVANYLKENGWIKDNYISEKVFINTLNNNLNYKELKLNYTVGELEYYGFSFSRNMRKSKKAKIFKLEKNNKVEYHVGYNNFKAITMYNRSNLYAMAVFELANKIKGSEVI